MLAAITQKTGSFTTCMARFKGEPDAAKVEEFISAISVFKDIENISDKDAVSGMPVLLEGEAATGG